MSLRVHRATMYGSFLRELRTSRSMTQAQLAETTGISQPNVSAYENDRRMPSLDVFNRIAVACGYLLIADGGHDETLHLPLPLAGWFPDEDLPRRLPDDPPDEPPTIGSDVPLDQRIQAIHDLQPDTGHDAIDLAVAVHQVLANADIPHVFGGSLGWSLYADPQMTLEVTVALSLHWEERDRVRPPFEIIGYHAPARPQDADLMVFRRDGVRERVAVSFLEGRCSFPLADHPRLVPLGYAGEQLPFASASELLARALWSNTDRDWVDVRRVIQAGAGFDLDAIERTVLAERGPSMHPRVARLRAMVAAGGEELR